MIIGEVKSQIINYLIEKYTDAIAMYRETSTINLLEGYLNEELRDADPNLMVTVNRRFDRYVDVRAYKFTSEEKGTFTEVSGYIRKPADLEELIYAAQDAT